MSTEIKNTENFDILEQEKQKVDRLLSMNYLTPDNAIFSPTPGGFVALTAEGNTYPRVTIYRTFPFTQPNLYLSVREPDDKAKEIGIIQDLSQWDEATQQIINKQLALRYYMPTILKVHSIKEEYGYAYWSVLTDRGPCRFTISSGSSSVVRLSDSHVIVKDIDENRYEIPDLTKLTPKELKRVDLYI